MNLTVVFALFAIAFASVNAAGCAYTDTDSGCLYNLSDLTVPMDSPASAFYSLNVTSGNATGMYNWNICSALNTTFSACDAGTAVCQTAGDASYSTGAVGSESWAAYAGMGTGVCPGVSLMYGGGQLCANGTVRTTTISVACDPAAMTPVTDSITEPDICQYLIMMRSAAACGTTGPANSTTTPTPSVSVTLSMSASMAATTDMTMTTTMSASATVSPTMSMSAMNTSGTTNGTATMTASVTVSPSASLSFGASVSPTVSISVGATPAESTGGSTWIWWVVGGIAIVVIVAAIAAAGFVVYKKKQQSYDSIGYE